LRRAERLLHNAGDDDEVRAIAEKLVSIAADALEELNGQ